MTPRQHDVVNVIAAFLQDDRSPTLMEIAEPLGLRAKSTIHEHLAKLEAMGVLVRDYRDEMIFKLLVDNPPPGTPNEERRTFFALKALLEQMHRAPTYDEID